MRAGEAVRARPWTHSSFLSSGSSPGRSLSSPSGAAELAVLYTDGIPEGRNAQGEDYSDAGLAALVQANRDLAAADICDTAMADVQGYACGTQPCDDITLVIVKRLAAAASG